MMGDVVFSHVVVGGGSAGCVLANRLSAQSSNRVLLVEAGIDTPPNAIPEDIADPYAGRAAMNPSYFWAGLRAELAVRTSNNPPRLAQYEQARIMGGGSSVNGQVITRGAPEDYDLWEQMGATGWGWNSVLPCFCRVERDLDFAGPEHGDSGPIPVRRIPRAQWDAFAEAAARDLEACGVPFHPDMNAIFLEGFAPLPINTLDGRRVSSAAGYLDEATRSRTNLSIRTGTTVRRIVFEGRRAVGVELVRPGGPSDLVRAGEVILSAGSIHSPTLLMRSGIGPASHLAEFDIPVVVNLPAVGQNLQEHPVTHVSAVLLRAGRAGQLSSRHNLFYYRYASGVTGTRAPDMLLNFAGRSGWHAVGRRLATIQACILQPFSRGTVRLSSAREDDPPEVRFEFLADERDTVRLMDAVRRSAALFAEPHLAAITASTFATEYSDRVRSAGRVTLRNRMAMGVLGALLDAPAPVRQLAVTAFINDSQPLATLLADPVALEAQVRRSVTGIWHATGTCRLGSVDDPAAVTDPAARVKGVGGLRVADASLAPEIPRCNTNLVAMMIGERVAEMISERIR